MTTKTLASHVSRKKTKQTEPIPGESQVQNNAGGYVYAIDKWAQLARFLVLGTSGGTFYVNERKLTRDNAAVVELCVAEDAARTVKMIVDISDAGRAPKNDPAVMALAIVASSKDVDARRLAYAALPQVCRIPTHLFQFLTFCKAMRGWSRGLRTAVKNWYGRWDVPHLAYELVKYQSREGISNRDVFRLAHPAGANSALLRWAIGANADAREVAPRRGSDLNARRYAAVGDELPAIVTAFEEAKTLDCEKAKDIKRLVKLIGEHNLTREMVPTQALNSKDVWDALLVKMPLTAMIRNLGKMTEIGLLSESAAKKQVMARLADPEYIRKSRVHPLTLLVAQKTYAQGHGDKGSLHWTPVTQIVDALDDAFYMAYGNVEPTGKRILLALDVSGSMGGLVSGLPIRHCEATAAMCLVTANVEKDYEIMGFATQFKALGISPRMRLDEAAKRTAMYNFGGTDCALPFQWAQKHGHQFDAFVVYTDNETWAGSVHPKQALASYRSKTGIAAKSVVVATAATPFSIADPKDPLMLDVVGFDTATPQALSEFIAR